MTSAPRVVRVNGPALRFIRQTKRATVSRLAAAANVSTSFLSRVERGVQDGVSAAVFQAVVAELGLPDPRALLCDPYSRDAGVIHNMLATLEPMATDGLQSSLHGQNDLAA